MIPTIEVSRKITRTIGDPKATDRDFCYYAIEGLSNDDGQVWLDRVQLEELRLRIDLALEATR